MVTAMTKHGGVAVASRGSLPAGGGQVPVRHGVVTFRDGLMLPYAEVGDPAGRPVVLLHGYTDSWRSFEPVLPHFPASLRVVAPTQRGHGEAGRPAGGYRLRDFASDLAAFMDALGIGAAVIVGHSMGSAVAQRFALDHPGRVAGLVLAGSFATARGNPGVEGLWRDAAAGLSDPVDAGFARAFQAATLARPVPADFLDMVVGESLKVPAQVWRAALAGLLEADHAVELGQIDRPTLVVWGDRDEFFPRSDQDALLGAIPNAQLLVYEGAGHGLHWEQPERFARNVAAFAEAITARL